MKNSKNNIINFSKFNSLHNPIIKFGRKKTKSNLIDVVFKEKSTSSIQCIFTYNDNNWYISDSDGTNRSLNGTWYLADDFSLLKNQGLIRFCSSILSVEYIDNNKID